MPVTQITNRNVQTAAITGVKLNVLTTKGDIMVYDTVADREAVGTNGMVLIADSTQATGVRWGSNNATAFQSLASDPGSPAAAAVWYNSTSGTFKGDTAYGTATIPQIVYVQTVASTTVSNTATETTFSTHFTIPANALTVGSTFRLTAGGIYIIPASVGTVNIQFNGKLGTNNWFDLGGVQAVDSTLGKRWILTGFFTVATTGSSGTASGVGELGIADDSYYLNTQSLSVDTTVANVVGVSVILPVALSTVSAVQTTMILEVLN
jgi:hypothetical protein